MSDFDLMTVLAPMSMRLGFQTQRHAVLASNLANADTPFYRAKDLEFSTMLNQSNLKQTHANHLSNPTENPDFATVEHAAMQRNDGNGVDLEQAMTAILQNRLHYQTGIEMLRRELTMLRTAAEGGG